MDQQRLGRILEMLTSSHEGEVVNAARMATKMLTDAGMTWTDLAKGSGGASSSDARPQGAKPKSYSEAPQAKREPSARRDYARQQKPKSDRKQKKNGIDAGDLATYLRAAKMHRLTAWEQAFTAGILARGRHPALSEAEWRCLWMTGLREGVIQEDAA